MSSAIVDSLSTQTLPETAGANPPPSQNQNNRNVFRGGSGRPRGGNPGRGGRGGRETQSNRADGRLNQRAKRLSSSGDHLVAPPIPPQPILGGRGSFGSRLTRDTENGEGDAKGKGNDGGHQDGVIEDVEAEVCFICASPVVHNSVAPCNHHTCHICALRLRALYKTKACAHCRTEANYVIFTDDATKRYEDFVQADFQQTDEILGIKYERKEIYDDTLLLLRYNCPEATCDIACRGWPALHHHVWQDHDHKKLCVLCTRYKKVFTHEHELFAVQELRKHERFGDDHPGAVDQTGFKGHPECGFCRERFYGDDELYTHCRDKHEKCHICDRRNPARQQQYYVDYENLEQHFRKDHFLCADQECIDKKFVVFESKMDLKAHQLEAHPNGLLKGRDARKIDISAFDYRAPQQDNRGGRRERDGRGRGRGRDPNTEALPQSTAQPMRRDELAYQRQMAIHNAQSATTRTFGGQLTSTDTYTARPVGGTQNTVSGPRNATATNNSPPLRGRIHLDLAANAPPASPTPAPSLTPQEQSRRLQHSAVMDRASAMLKNDPAQISDFRSHVSSYRTSAITESQLIDALFSLFDQSSADLGKLIKELADIYENEAKRNGLLRAWNDWRAINEDYPSLPGPNGVLPGSSVTAAGNGGHRVLKLKSSTAQSSRSAVSKQGSWGNASNFNPFPTMPAVSANGVEGGNVAATPWVGSSSASRPSPATSRPTSRPPPPNKATPPATDAFPALPAAAKPNTMIFGLTRGTVRWDEPKSGGNPTNPWGTAGGGGSSGTVTPAALPAGGVDEEPEVGKKKKGSKNKKQTLYKFG